MIRKDRVIDFETSPDPNGGTIMDFASGVSAA